MSAAGNAGDEIACSVKWRVLGQGVIASALLLCPYSPKCLEEVRLLKKVLWSDEKTVPVA
jgi:hypothetical protein